MPQRKIDRIAIISLAVTLALACVSLPFLFFAALALSFGGAILSPPSPSKIETEDLVGIWQADYSENQLFSFDLSSHTSSRILGIEILTLSADGTYRQMFIDIHGSVYTSPGSSWRFEDNEVHLEGGRYYPLGPEDAEGLAEGRIFIYFYDRWGGSFSLDRSEVVLQVLYDARYPRGIILEYPPIGDPDSPELVIYEFIE